MSVEKSNPSPEPLHDAALEEPVERPLQPVAVKPLKVPVHSRDSIHMVAAVMLCILWFGVVMISAWLRPASPEIEKLLSWMFGGATLLTGIGGLVWRQALRMSAALDAGQQQIERLAISDPMTGVFNHTGFVSVLERDLARSKRYGHVFSVMVLDIDFIRRINDGYGHAVGDQVIVSLAATITSTLRNVDFVGRISGARFALGLPDTTLEQAGLLAERLRERIAGVEVPGVGGEHVRYTVSVGVALQLGDDAASVMSRASAAMQLAKDQGRNRVVTDQTTLPNEVDISRVT